MVSSTFSTVGRKDMFRTKVGCCLVNHMILCLFAKEDMYVGRLLLEGGAAGQVVDAAWWARDRFFCQQRSTKKERDQFTL